MGLQNETPKPTENPTEKMEIKLREALEKGLVSGSVKKALEEFYEWYDWRYVMPVTIVKEGDYITLYVYYDITEELEVCEKACVEHARKELMEDEYSEEDIAGSCYDSCMDDIVRDINEDFGEIRRYLFKCLDRHGLKYDWEDSWDYNTRYLAVDIKNDIKN